MSTDDEDEYVSVLIRELENNTSIIENAALELEKDSNKVGSIEEIRMALHSLKGLFGFLSQDFAPLRIITHQLEDHFLESGATIIDLLLKYCDENRKLIERLRAENSTNIYLSDLYLDLNSELNPEISLDQKYKLIFTFIEKSSMKTARMLALINKLKRISTIQHTSPDMDELFEIDDFSEGIIELVTREPKQSLQDAISRVPELQSYSIIEVDVAKEKGRTEQRPTISSKIEVDITQLDRVINMVEEFILVGNIINNVDKSNLSSAEINILSSFNQRVVEMQDIIFSLKQIPASTILKPIPRLVRDLAKKLDKIVNVHTAGGNVGIDRPVVEVMSDVLVILVQNSIVHGIEDPEVRLKSKKNSSGTLTIAVSQEDGSIVFTVSDDGAGMDYKRLWAKGVEVGVIDKHDTFDPEVAKDLIFISGFSTADETDMTSGRGVGLASIRKDITELGGTISVQTEVGKGTDFIIRLPSTKPIVPVIITSVGDHTFGFPQTGVLSIERVKDEFKEKLEDENFISENVFFIERGGEKQKIINLIKRFSRHNLSYESLSLIHWKFGDDQFSFMVNEINEIMDMAINYDDPFVGQIPYLAGTSLMEAERLLLILKPSALV